MVEKEGVIFTWLQQFQLPKILDHHKMVQKF